MFAALPRILEVFPKFNVEAIGEIDFWRACKKEKFIVRELPLLVNGYYERRGGRDYILINAGLRGDDWLFTALHEFSHALLDVPYGGANFTLYHVKGAIPHWDRRERFADDFATIALIPLPELIDLLETEIQCGEVAHRIDARLRVLRRYGI